MCKKLNFYNGLKSAVNTIKHTNTLRSFSVAWNTSAMHIYTDHRRNCSPTTKMKLSAIQQKTDDPRWIHTLTMPENCAKLCTSVVRTLTNNRLMIGSTTPFPSFSGLHTTVEIIVANANNAFLFHVRSPKCRILTYSILCEYIYTLRYHGSRD